MHLNKVLSYTHADSIACFKYKYHVYRVTSHVSEIILLLLQQLISHIIGLFQMH